MRRSYNFTTNFSEKLRRALRFHKIRSTFYTELTLRKLLCKPKDRVAAEDKNNITYEISFIAVISVIFISVISVIFISVINYRL